MPAQTGSEGEAGAAWALIEPLFEVPESYAGRFGPWRSPLTFSDGSPVESPDDWERRRGQLLDDWHSLMGRWPDLLEAPRCEVISETEREGFVQRRVRVDVAPDQFVEGWLLAPPGEGPFPAVLVPFYEADTSVGLGEREGRDFARQLTRRGFVTLSIGTPAGDAWKPDRGAAACQPLSYYAYVAANCQRALDDILDARVEVAHPVEAGTEARHLRPLGE